MYKPFRIVILNPSPVIPNAVRNLILLLRINSVRNLILSGKDCHVASLLAMTFIKESLNLGILNKSLNDFMLSVKSLIHLVILRLPAPPSFTKGGQGGLLVCFLIVSSVPSVEPPSITIYSI
jgi:hypothetical protein